MAWHYNKKVDVLYATTVGGGFYSWARIVGMGWMRIRGDNPHTGVIMSNIAAVAFQHGRDVHFFEEPAGYILNIYTT